MSKYEYLDNKSITLKKKKKSLMSNQLKIHAKPIAINANCYRL